MFQSPQSRSPAPPPPISRGSSPVELIFSFSQGDVGSNISTLALQPCISNDIIHSYELSLWQKHFVEPFCVMPLKNPAGVAGSEPHDQKDKA